MVDTALVVGAGSVITSDVAAGALGLERNEQTQKDGWAARFRARRRAEKDATEAPHSAAERNKES